MARQGTPPQNCANLSRHNENVIGARLISTLVALTQKFKIPRKSKGRLRTAFSTEPVRGKSTAKNIQGKDAQKRKKPAAGGGAAGFKLDR
ncbi:MULTISPECIES: hypothetical protein [Rhizobium/Agrobacterium group]|uniref:hypothetical protein n=1 Tax=Rhizobium/Agrobacterium group TaxID=227290 RepID=UPI0013C3F7DE|nr:MULTISPECIES: hypothetical protein [Rhizobium/Agrobacterium group]NTB96329.1 hypothetical protein [Agrobacterium tumefaciens]NTC43706.1 hypothetical protein [Agrobacterium tumefaciens]